MRPQLPLSIVEYHADAISAEEEQQSERAAEAMGLSERGDAQVAPNAVGSHFSVVIERKALLADRRPDTNRGNSGSDDGSIGPPPTVPVPAARRLATQTGG